MLSEKIIYKKLNNDFFFRIGERDIEGKKYFFHLDVFNYNKEIKKKLMEGMVSTLSVLKNNNINEIYFLCEVDNHKLLKFASLFLKWEYLTTLTLHNNKEYNVLIYRNT